MHICLRNSANGRVVLSMAASANLVSVLLFLVSPLLKARYAVNCFMHGVGLRWQAINCPSSQFNCIRGREYMQPSHSVRRFEIF